MNYDSEINELVNSLKEDKTIIQPWRNKAISRLEEVQAFIRMGKTTAYQPKGDPNQIIPGPLGGRTCSCSTEVRKVNCPVHGL